MIDAVELPRVALALAADQRAAMAADVEQRAHLALPVAAEDHRPAGDLAGAEVAGIFDLRGVADVDPALVEDRAVLVLQDFRRDEHLAVDLEGQVLQVLDHEAVAVAVGMAVSVAMIEHVGLQRMPRGAPDLAISLYLSAANRPPPPDAPARPRGPRAPSAGSRARPRPWPCPSGRRAAAAGRSGSPPRMSSSTSRRPGMLSPRGIGISRMPSRP